jgi:hypothetical protein
MSNLTALRIAVGVTLLTGLPQAAPAAEILIVDAKSQPESLTIAPGVILFVGSTSTPFVYKVCSQGRPLLRSSSVRALKVPESSSSACWPMLLAKRCGRAS